MRTVYKLETGIVHIRSKAKQFANKFTFGIAAGVASLSLAIIPLASAATTVVTPSNPGGWYIQGGTGGTVSYVSATGAMGNGAVEFTTNTATDYTRFKNDINTKLSDITSLSYMTNQVSVPEGSETTADVNLRLYVDNDNNGTVDDVLVYEPYYNAEQVITPGWQTWNVSQSTGFWWSNNNLTYEGHTTTGAGGYDTNFHLSSVLHDWQDANVVSIGLGTGTDNAPWTVQADALTVNDTTYNFETDPATVTATNKDQCKGSGWHNVTDSNGKSFKNQGDCVSFVATKGKNVANTH